MSQILEEVLRLDVPQKVAQATGKMEMRSFYPEFKDPRAWKPLASRSPTNSVKRRRWVNRDALGSRRGAKKVISGGVERGGRGVMGGRQSGQEARGQRRRVGSRGG